MNKKTKGIIATALLTCTTLACGMAASSYSDSANKYASTYSYSHQLGGLNMVVTGTSNLAMTVSVNTQTSTYMISTGVKCYSYDSDGYISGDSDIAAKGQGGAISVGISRDWDDSDYRYEHTANRWVATSSSQCTPSTLLETQTYTVTQIN